MSKIPYLRRPITAVESRKLKEVGNVSQSHLNPHVSLRFAHIRRLFDILVTRLLSDPVSDDNGYRVWRAWYALVSCWEFPGESMWLLAVAVANRCAHVMALNSAGFSSDSSESTIVYPPESNPFLNVVTGTRPNLVEKLRQRALFLISKSEMNEALTLLESYLSNEPYSSSSTLYYTAGIVSLSLASEGISIDELESVNAEADIRRILSKTNQMHRNRLFGSQMLFRHAFDLDKEFQTNSGASYWLSILESLNEETG